VLGHKNNPAGMWQIMPATARALGMRMDKRYDGRLDASQATDKIMALLRRYHDDLGDWRMVDYAYNAGEFSVRNLIGKYGMPPADPAIPRMPVKRITRDHLVKLLAMACVVREPDRFHVSLPTLTSDQRLVKVEVDKAMPMAQAASHAGMSVSDFKFLNPGFRNDTIDPNLASYLLLPSSKAEQFRQTSTPSATAALDMPLASAEGAALAAADDAPPPSSDKKTTYKVKSGDTLSTIARRHGVTVKQLQRWNHLSNAHLKPGQVIAIAGG
jgi:membrane-bound lytic murein transglycosylase D